MLNLYNKILLNIIYAKTSVEVPRRCRVNIPFEPYPKVWLPVAALGFPSVFPKKHR